MDSRTKRGVLSHSTRKRIFILQILGYVILFTLKRKYPDCGNLTFMEALVFNETRA